MRILSFKLFNYGGQKQKYLVILSACEISTDSRYANDSFKKLGQFGKFTNWHAIVTFVR